MKLISFSWTSPALLAGRKTVTRRSWDNAYAAKFHRSDVVQAYDKGPRVGGKRIGFCRIESVTKERTSYMPDEDYEAEGFAYFDEHTEKRGPQLFPGYGTMREAFQAWRCEDLHVWVIRFRFSKTLKGLPHV